MADGLFCKSSVCVLHNIRTVQTKGHRGGYRVFQKGGGGGGYTRDTRKAGEGGVLSAQARYEKRGWGAGPGGGGCLAEEGEVPYMKGAT